MGEPQPWTYQPSADLGLPPGERLKSVRRESGLVASFFHLLWWTLVRGYLRLFHRLEITGRENLPGDTPFVMIANHASHLDALVLCAPLPTRLRDNILPVAAGDTFFQTRSASIFAALFLNALPLWRRRVCRHAIAELRERMLTQGCAYVLFPEGTRSRDGELGDFKPGLGVLLGGTEVPLIPCHIEGAAQAMPPGTRIPRPRKIILRVGKPVTVSDLGNDRRAWIELAKRARAAVVKTSQVK